MDGECYTLKSCSIVTLSTTGPGSGPCLLEKCPSTYGHLCYNFREVEATGKCV